ncbi:MAG: chromosome partitioning protein ParB, partial [Actinobacteria bacterium]|nr:chromosome partitioning protein ParB [Actinomycetota bacterium]
NTRVRIKGGNSGGTIIIEFADSVDLQRIVNELT